jgi:nitroimidazol reductase NimA-like FMN-containing flavoprotein (pyridoxamine 5'-phosphate oxidase superfamily)
MEVDRSGSEVLGENECLTLLEQVSIGRVGLSVGALPVVLPVNFVLVPGGILLRTSEGAKLHAAWDQAVVAFEADHFDPLTRTGWSVLVQGRSRVVTDAVEIERHLAQPLLPWADPFAERFVEIRCERVSGRRVGHLQPHLGNARVAAPPSPA